MLAHVVLVERWPIVKISLEFIQTNIGEVQFIVNFTDWFKVQTTDFICKSN